MRHLGACGVARLGFSLDFFGPNSTDSRNLELAGVGIRWNYPRSTDFRDHI